MTEPDLAGARRRVQRFGVAMLALAVAGGGVKLVDFLVSRSERSHQEECTENLAAICFAERMAQANSKPFITHIADLPAPIPRGNRFAYFLGSGPMEDRWPDAGPAPKDATSIGVDPTGWSVPPQMKARVSATQLPDRFAGDAGLGVSGVCPGLGCQFVAACAGNLDLDDDLDVWSASTQPRQGPAGTIEPCQPFHDHADLDR